MKTPSLNTLVKKFVVITDTREQQPYKFPNQIFRKLDYGDYSIAYEGKSYEAEIVVERKANVSEIFTATGKQRERWERELEGLKKIQLRFVLCEFDFMAYLNEQPPGILEPSAVYGSTAKWHAVQNVPFIYCGNRRNARAYLWKVFYEFTKHRILSK